MSKIWKCVLSTITFNTYNMTCQGIIILYTYLIFSFSRSDTFIHWCYFKREGMTTFFHFFRSSPNTIYVHNQRNVQCCYVFKNCFYPVLCIIIQEGWDPCFFAAFIVYISVEGSNWGCTWWRTERYSNKELFPHGKTV